MLRRYNSNVSKLKCKRLRHLALFFVDLTEVVEKTLELKLHEDLMEVVAIGAKTLEEALGVLYLAVDIRLVLLGTLFVQVKDLLEKYFFFFCRVFSLEYLRALE